jgi:hypothetical protein
VTVKSTNTSPTNSGGELALTKILPQNLLIQLLKEARWKNGERCQNMSNRL